MARQLVFVHGRAQQHKDAVALKGEWVAAFEQGLALSGLTLPIAETDIRFPYYGQTLYDLVSDAPPDEVARVIVRGDDADDAQREFLRSVLEEVRRAAVTDAQFRDVAGRDVLQRGPLNWGWLQSILEAVDTYVPGASGASIAIATNDVYQYLKNFGIRDAIDRGVRAAIAPGVPTVVVAHSLGTVVAYSLLRRDGDDAGWDVPLFVTLGSPLAVTAIKKSFRPIRSPACVEEWFNAMDGGDIVALYPLDVDHFDIDPPIVNKTDVENSTPNQHGIAGYLSDREVALRIYDALVADG